MKKVLYIAAAAVLAVFTAGTSAFAADSACAKVVIEIAQELTTERQAFDAKLVLTNNLPDKDLTDVRVDVYLKDIEGNLKTDMFFMKLSSKNNITAVDGTGMVKAGTAAEVHWLIIPSPGAGGETSAGVAYFAGATLTYSIDGNQEIVPINPDKITVKPTAQLVLDYFVPYAVLGDNPFTPDVEAPVPYELAVRVTNDGYGPAWKLKIDSAQPKIVENKQGLLIDFQLLGSSVNDAAVNPTLMVDMGDVASKDISTAYWSMISTLSGRFEDFKVTFTHSDDLGGKLTSLIRETNAYYLTHRVRVNLAGRDKFLDFLADTDKDAEHLPDTIFESEYPAGMPYIESTVAPVTVVYPTAPPQRPTAANQDVEVTLDMSAHPTGWIYTKMDDPAQGMQKLLGVVRADGVRLDPNNYWIDKGLDKDYKTIYKLQFVDYRDEASPASYTLYYSVPEVDVTPPLSALVLDGPDLTADGRYFITPQTRIIVIAGDNDGGSGIREMYYKVIGRDADFKPAFPFTLQAGTYSIEYYSVDNSGNAEAPKSANITVDNSAPDIAAFTATPNEFTPYVPDGMAADRTVDFIVNATDTVGNLKVKIEIVDADGVVVRTLVGTAASGVDTVIIWDGKNSNGVYVSTGTYTAKLSVSDGLDNVQDENAPTHTAVADITVTAVEWFSEKPVAPNVSAEQINPAASGNRIVWQDMRNGNWDIYLKEKGQETLNRITSNAANQENPAIDGNIVVWQDKRNANVDIYGFDLAANHEFEIYGGTGEQIKPSVAGVWVVWQDNRNGNWDIYAKNIQTGETIQITNHERDQIRPAISGNTIVWEDYRNGLGEIYRYNIVSRQETRITVNFENQTMPAISGDMLVWVDQRDGKKAIYRYNSLVGDVRITYGNGDNSDPDVLGTTVVYTDYESGSDDPNLSFVELVNGRGGRLTSNIARQEKPVLGSDFAVWQDDRDGIYQIYTSALKIEPLPITVDIMPGYNLIAVGQTLVDTHASAGNMLTALSGKAGLVNIGGYINVNNLYVEAPSSDFGLTAGMGVVVYSESAGAIEVAAAGESAEYVLVAGTNYIGMLAVPYGYSAYDIMNSVGLENVQSIRRFDNKVGAWQTVATRTGPGGFEIIGMNYVIRPGDGLIVTMKKRVDNWKP